MDKISISVSTATISLYDLRQDGKDNIFFFFFFSMAGNWFDARQDNGAPLL